MKYLGFILMGILISNSADLYCRVTFEKWVEDHKPKTVGMPVKWSFCLAEFIARPIDKFAENNITCGLLERD